MKKQFINIQGKRYRLTSIKRYEPFEVDGKIENKYGIYIYFAPNRSMERVYHNFATEQERDSTLHKLDNIFETV